MLQFNSARVQSIDELTGGNQLLRAFYVAAAKDAEASGLGKFVDGRKGNPSRYIPAGMADPYASTPNHETTAITLTVDSVVSATGADRAIVTAWFKAIDESGAGSYLVGRKGNPSRLCSVAGLAADDSE